MKRVINCLACIICMLIIYACNNQGSTARTCSDEDLKKIAMWDSVFGRTLPDQIANKGVVVHDTAWVRRAINRYQKFYDANTKDPEKAKTTEVLYHLDSLLLWLMKVKVNTDADSVLVFFGKYPTVMVNNDTDPCTVSDCDMPDPRPHNFKRHPKRITAIFWPYKGNAPAKPKPNKGVNGDADPFNLGEIRP